MDKKKILIHSDSSQSFTGFGKNMKNILKYLYSTGKYEIIEFANHVPWDHPKTKMRPWNCQGSLPNNPFVLSQLQKDRTEMRKAMYGLYTVEDAIKEYKPDIYLGIQDIWAFGDSLGKSWWNKPNCIIWTTLDSLPILPDAVEAAPKIHNYYVWSSFAEKEMNNQGFDHVKTLHGSIDHKNFFRFSEAKRSNLKAQYSLSDQFVIGFVFRNQLRKSVPNLLEGFKIFKNKHPKSKLLLHTHWGEGWDIERLIKEKNLNKEDILTTYCCSSCGHYSVMPFQGKDQNCPNCKSEKTFDTTNTKNGVDEEQLNEIYNLMDVYCHPFTSGGMEIPVFEAKLTELITLVTNYSCGEDSCTEESGGLPLDWAEYREPGTQFIKASTYAESIAEQLEKVFAMSEHEKSQIGQKARKFVIDNYSVNVVGSQLEEIFDSLPGAEYSLSDESNKENGLESVLDEGKRIAIVMPESAGDVLWVNSILDNFSALYPEHDIYFITKPQFAVYAEDHPAVHKVIPYNERFDNLLFSEGKGDHKGYFDLAFVPHVGTQKILTYTHNGQDKTQLKLYEN